MKRYRISFKARGRRVSFLVKKPRTGKMPKHLKPYLFTGARKRRRKSAWPKGKVPPHLRQYLFARKRSNPRGSRRITKQQWYDLGGFANSRLWRRQRGGSWQYFIAD